MSLSLSEKQVMHEIWQCIEFSAVPFPEFTRSEKLSEGVVCGYLRLVVCYQGNIHTPTIIRSWPFDIQEGGCAFSTKYILDQAYPVPVENLKKS